MGMDFGSMGGGGGGGMGAAGWAGSAAEWAGAIMQDVAGILARDAMYDEYKKELKRQKGFAGEATGELGQRIGTAGVDTMQSDMASGAAQRLALYAQLANSPTTLGADMQSARDAAVGRAWGKDRAKLGSYSDWQVEQALRDLRTQQALNRITDKAGGSVSVLPYSMYNAQHSQDTLAGIGSILSSGGKTGGAIGQMVQGNQPKAMPMQQPSGYGVHAPDSSYAGMDPSLAEWWYNYQNNPMY